MDRLALQFLPWGQQEPWTHRFRGLMHAGVRESLSGTTSWGPCRACPPWPDAEPPESGMSGGGAFGSVPTNLPRTVKESQARPLVGLGIDVGLYDLFWPLAQPKENTEFVRDQPK